MPQSVSGINRSSNVTGQESWADIGRMFKYIAASLAKKLCVAMKIPPPPIYRLAETSAQAQAQATAPAQGAAQGAVPAQAAAQAQAAQNAAPAVGGANAPQPANPDLAFNAKNWLKEQCESLENALKSPGGQGEVRLEGLYAAAKSFKEQILGIDQAQLRYSWPGDLHNDFEENLNEILKHFTDAAETPISLAELKFLQSYVGFMKNCLTGSDQELDEKLGQIKSLLGKAIDKSEEEIVAQQTELQTARSVIDTNNTRVGELTDRIEILERTQNRTTAQNNELNEKREELNTLNNDTQAKQAEITSLKSKIEELEQGFTPQGPTPQDTTQLKEEADAAAEAVRQAEASLDATDQNTPPAELTRLAQNVFDAQTFSDQKQEDFAQAESRNAALQTSASQIKADTEKMMNSAQVEHAVALGLGAIPEIRAPRAIFDASVKHLEKQFNTVSAFAVRCKNPSKRWLNTTLEIRNEFAKLNANPNHQITLSQEARSSIRNYKPDNPKACNFQFAYDNKTTNAYEHACDVIDPRISNEDQGAQAQRALQIAGNAQAAPDNSNKKLALVMIGSWCAQQTMVKSDDFANINSDTSRTLDAAADMLAGKLTSEAEKTPPAGNTVEENNIATKKRIETLAKTRQISSVQQELKALPRNTELETYKNLFLNALALNTSASLEGVQYSPRQLLEIGKTDRTFRSDQTAHVLVKAGKSRQDVFKESMLRVVAVISPRDAAGQEQARVGARIPAAKHKFEQIGVERAKTELGLRDGYDGEAINEKLLDQLVLASIAQNDFTMDADHAHRGSMANKIERYDNNKTRETIFKNHSLGDYKHLSDVLIEVATNIRGDVDEAIEKATDELNKNSQPVRAKQIQRLVKQIIVTTDSKSALSEHFNLEELVTSSENLIANDTPENRKALKAALTETRLAWGTALTGDQTVPNANAWDTKDGRSLARKVVSFNPIRNLPFVNRVPILAPLCNTGFGLAKATLGASAGVAAGAIGVAAVIATCPLALVSFSAYKGAELTKR